MDGVKITVTADTGVFPADAVLSVGTVPVYQQAEADSAVKKIRDEDQKVAVSYIYDIKVINPETGEEYQPAEGQTAGMSFELAEVADENLTANVYHITEEETTGELTAEELDVTTEVTPETGEETTATVETDNFSIYKVEFTYNKMEYVLPGDSSVTLSEILAAVGLTGEVTDVAVSDDTLFSASDETGEWIVTAHRAFDTVEWMRVTINGVTYEITVTDSREDIGVSYVERSWDGSTVVSETKTMEAVEVPSDGKMTSGWYYLKNDVTVNGRIESITGDVNLILGDGCTLDVKGLYVPESCTLTIYARSDGESAGRIVSNPSGGAGIGGYSGHDSGNIVIHGGIIETKGHDHCAGIGSNDGRTGGAITIYGGNITAKGGSDGAGIGGGRNCDGGTVTIYGGEITANGPTDSDTCENGAGIGGGYQGAGGNISIYGGTVTAYCRDGAGIGGGDEGAGGNITIHGGTITSTRVNQGQGARIGGGCDAAPGTITIDGGNITTDGGSGAGIGGGKRNKAGGSVTIKGGVVDAGGSYGIGSGEDGADVAVALGYTDATKAAISIHASTYNGTVTLEKPFARYDGDNGDTLSGRIDAGTVSDNNSLKNGYLKEWVDAVDPPVSYIEYSWNGAALETTEKTSSEYTVVTSGLFKTNPKGLTSGDYVVRENTTVEDYFYIRKGCTVNLIVPAGVTLTCKQGIGCGYDRNGEYATLNIFGEGKIVANGKDYAAGIGGKDDETNGNITVHGTDIEATGGHHGAGIGGGEGGKDPDGTTSIKIYEGTIDATGGTDGAGIGGGDCQPGAHTYIYKGLIFADGGKHGAGIGGGDEEGTLGIFIYGGSVIVTGGDHGAGIGAGEGGGNLRKAPNGGINISGGSLNVIGGVHGAGIGGGCNEDASGTIVISGSAKGTIRGGEYAAGIGSGFADDEWNGDMDIKVTISGTDGLLSIYGGDKGAEIGGGRGGNMEGTFHMTGGEVYVEADAYGAGIGGGCERDDFGGEGGDCYLGGGTLTVCLREGKGNAKAIGGGHEDDTSGSVYIHKNNNETGRYMRVANLRSDEQSTAEAGKRSGKCHYGNKKDSSCFVYITECDHKEHFTGESGFDYVFDENGHTGTCRYCGYTETHPHTYNDVSDICTVCGYNAGFSFVFFNSNGGSEVPTQMVVNGQKAVRPEDPTHEEGLTFKGWYETTNLNGGLAPAPFDFENRVLDHKIVILQAVWAHEHDGITFVPWNSDESLPAEAGNYYLTKDVTLTDTWTWSNDKLDLCLNGHTVIAAGQGQYGLHITGGQVDLFDGEGGTITQAGTISDAIVFVEGGTLNMHGGAVTGSAHTGVSVSTDGSVSISGDVRIRGNGEHNVFLSGGAALSVADTLDEEARIGVSMETGSGVFTTGLSGRGSEDNFSADEDSCIVTVHDDGEAYIDRVFTVTFDSDGGSEAGVQTVVNGQKAARPEDPTRIGFIFKGWYQVTDDGNPEDTGFDFENTPINEDITLRAVWEETTQETVIIKSANVEFQGQIRLKFTLNFPESVLADEAAYVSFAKAGTVTTKLVSEGSKSGNDVEFIIPVPAPEHVDDIIIKVYSGDGGQLVLQSSSGTDYTADGFAYSVRKYAKNKSLNGSTQKMRNLAKALYDYGTAAQIYFRYGDYSGTAVDSAVTAVTLDDLAPYALTTEGTRPGGVTGANINVEFESDNTLRITFKTDGSRPLTGYTFLLDDKETKPGKSGRNAYLQVKNIAAPNLDTPHTFTVTDGTDTYTVRACALSYAYTSVKNGDSARQDLGKALYLYNQAADAYFVS